MMLYPIAVEELLRRVVVIEADSQENAIAQVEKCYEKERIVLNSDDLVPDPYSGAMVNIFPAFWYDDEMIQHITPIQPAEEEAV